jgi:hypothetical protein
MNRLDFMTSSLGDIQATIRALDVKISAVMVCMFSPIAVSDKIYDFLKENALKDHRAVIYWITIWFILSWITAVFLLIRAIGAIENPSSRVQHKTGGTYYAGNLFDLGFFDTFYIKDIIKSKTSVDGFLGLLPKDSNEFELELCFEIMKLAFIRDVKIIRFKFGICFSVMFSVLGGVVFFWVKLLG